MSIVKLNNQEVEFDVFDVESMEKYEKATEELQKKVDEEKAEIGVKNSERLRKQCHIVFDFFNDIFGEGTDKKIFGNQTNVRVCITTMQTFIEFVNGQSDQLNETMKKYSPNRAQRRAQGK